MAAPATSAGLASPNPATFRGRRRVNEVVVITDPAMLGGDDLGYGPAARADDFDAYVRLHSQAFCRGAYLLTGDRHLAEDLVQTALAKVAHRWDHIVARGEPTPYVRTVIIRTAIAWRRRRWRGEVPTSPVPDETGGDPLGAVDGRERLRQALLAVP